VKFLWTGCRALFEQGEQAKLQQRHIVVGLETPSLVPQVFQGNSLYAAVRKSDVGRFLVPVDAEMPSPTQIYA